MDNMVAINDTIATRDNQRLRVLRVVLVGNNVHRLECVDDNDPRGPCRINVPKENFLRILQKSPWKLDSVGRRVDAVTGKPWTVQTEEVKK